MQIKTQKPCKTCEKKPRHPGRTECLTCINKKTLEKAKIKQKQEREKQREKSKIQKEKTKIRKQKIADKKRFSRQNLIKEADRVFSLYIRERDRDKPCVTCGNPWEENHQCGHFISRRFLNSRWTERNAHGQCPKCNMWGAGEQYLHSQAVEKMYGKGTAERLQKLANSTEKVTDEEILEIIRKYYQELGKMAVEFTPKKYYLK